MVTGKFCFMFVLMESDMFLLKIENIISSSDWDGAQNEGNLAAHLVIN